MKEHPLSKGPVFNSAGLLSDVEQLQAVVRLLSDELKNLVRHPRRILGREESLVAQSVALHEATCPNCAHLIGTGEVPIEEAVASRMVLDEVFRAYAKHEVEQQQRKQSAAQVLREVEAVVEELYGPTRVASLSSAEPFFIGANPFLQ